MLGNKPLCRQKRWEDGIKLDLKMGYDDEQQGEMAWNLIQCEGLVSVVLNLQVL